MVNELSQTKCLIVFLKVRIVLLIKVDFLKTMSYKIKYLCKSYNIYFLN